MRISMAFAHTSLHRSSWVGEVVEEYKYKERENEGEGCERHMRCYKKYSGAGRFAGTP